MKITYFVAILGVFAVARSEEAHTKSLVTQIIENIINENKGQLINLSFSELDMCIYGTLSNIVIKNLENLVIEKLEAPGPLSVDISNATFSLNNASASAIFNLVHLRVPEIGLDLTGIGEVSGFAQDLFVTFALNMNLQGLSIQLLDFTDLYIGVGSITGTADGLENAEENLEIINTKLAGYLSDNLTAFAYKYKYTIIDFVNGLLSNILNNETN